MFARWPASQGGFTLVEILGFLVIYLTFSVSSVRASSSSQSPSADTDLICTPLDPSDCYPKIFVAENEFRAIREGQEIPPGLHVRLNIQTGQKEAKIYNLNEADDPALAGFHVDSAVVVVEPNEAGSEEEIIGVPAGAPEYDTAGSIKQPEMPESADDYSALSVSMTELRNAGKTKWVENKQDDTEKKSLVGHLENLEDLAHDIYFGLKITEDEDALKVLFCLMSPPSPGKGKEDIEIERLAATIVAAATQNNPKALEQVSKNWATIRGKKCAGSQPQGPFLATAFYDGLVTQSPRTTRAKVAALNGLIKDRRIQKEFLAGDGMSRLLSIIVREEGDGWESTKTKVGHFVLDNFLDENMGAILGVWPPEQKTSGCNAGEDRKDRLPDWCWAFYLRNIAKDHELGEGHWSQDLYEKLTAQSISRDRHEDL